MGATQSHVMSGRDDTTTRPNNLTRGPDMSMDIFYIQRPAPSLTLRDRDWVQKTREPLFSQVDITVGASLPKLLPCSFWKKWKNLCASRKACSSFSTTECYGSCAIRLSLAMIALRVESSATSDGIMREMCEKRTRTWVHWKKKYWKNNSLIFLMKILKLITCNK